MKRCGDQSVRELGDAPISGCAPVADNQTASSSASPERRAWARVALLIAPAVILPWVCGHLSHANYRGSSDLHAAMEIVGALFGLVAGLALVAQFVALGERFHLLLGLAFFVNGAEDLAHGLIGFTASRGWTYLTPEELARCIPGTYVTGRFLLGAILLWAGVRHSSLGQSRRAARETIWVSGTAVVLMVGVTILAFYSPLPKFIFPDQLVPRPVDFASAILLLAALAAFLWRLRLRSDVLLGWIALSIAVNVAGQTVMSFSRAFYDLSFDVAHVCKIVGYAVPLLGLALHQIRIITDRVRAEAEAQLARSIAEAANRSKSNFLANMSHEIRTPMAAVLGYAEQLLEPGLTDTDRLDAIHTIRRNGEHLLAIINDVLDLSKIEAGKLSVDRVTCRPHRIVTEVAALMRVRATAKCLRFDVEYSGPLPATIQTDPTRLRQILINLIGNGLKFTEVGNVRLVVAYAADRAQLRFDVLDTGPGIPADRVAEIFQRFNQLDTSSSRMFGGTGLGLTISRCLAQMLGGDVVLLPSDSGTGAHFCATIATGSLAGVRMLHNPDAETTPDSNEPLRETPLAAELDGRVLLAEDSPDNQRLMVRVLTKAGALVTVVENGELAVDAALKSMTAGRPYDVILMDMQMPIRDGYSATSLLRRRGYAGPIVALTAHAMIAARDKCLAAGCDDCATKPITRGALIECVAEWTRRGRQGALTGAATAVTSSQ